MFPSVYPHYISCEHHWQLINKHCWLLYTWALSWVPLGGSTTNFTSSRTVVFLPSLFSFKWEKKVCNYFFIFLVSIISYSVLKTKFWKHTSLGFFLFVFICLAKSTDQINSLWSTLIEASRADSWWNRPVRAGSWFKLVTGSCARLLNH